MTIDSSNGNGTSQGAEAPNSLALPAEYSWGNPPPTGNAFFGELIGVDPITNPVLPMRNYRPYSLAQPYNLRDRLRAGKSMIIGGLGVPSPDVARMIAAAGYDAVFIDWEHSPMSIREVTELIKWVNYASEGACAVIVRVPNFEHTNIAWVLDAGASGIILPHTETVEQAEEAVAAARFPYGEGGKRSFPPFSLYFGVNDGGPPGKLPFDLWNSAAVFVQIESGAGCDNADALLAIPGVDGAMIGAGDLRMDLGLAPGIGGSEPEYIDAVAKVTAASKRHNKPLMSFARGKADFLEKAKSGVSLFIAGADVFILGKGFRSNVAETHATIKEANAEGAKIPV